MEIFAVLALALLGTSAAAVLFFRCAAVRVPPHTAEEQIDEFEHRRGMDVSLLREGLAWYRAQEKQTVSIVSFDGVRLVGDYLPAEGKARGRVLLFHGYHGGVEDYAALLPFYHSLGCDLLAVDERAHGRSGGKYIGYGVLERRDCCAWAREADRRWGEKPAFLAGMSMGASTVLMAAGESLPRDVRGIIADCGFASPREEICHVMRRRTHLPARPMYDLMNLVCRFLAGYGFDDCTTGQALGRSRLPVLLIHGGADTFVPPEMSRQSFDACRGERRLVTVPGAGHCQSCLKDPEGYRRAVEEFLLTHTQEPEKA